MAPEDLLIPGTGKSPTVKLKADGFIKIQGRSIPEDAKAFFEKVMDWLEKYVENQQKKTTVNISFEYLNSGTSKFMLQMLRLLKDKILPGNELTINWYYEEGDDDILERGEYFSSLLDLKINFIEVE